MKQTHPRTNLYRLKSNPTTIVMRLGDHQQKVVWTDTMAKYGVNDAWIIGRFIPDNAVKLTKEESREIKNKIKAFLKNFFSKN